MDTLVLSYQQKKNLLFHLQPKPCTSNPCMCGRSKGHGTSSNMLNNAESSIHMWHFGWSDSNDPIYMAHRSYMQNMLASVNNPQDKSDSMGHSPGQQVISEMKNIKIKCTSPTNYCTNGGAHEQLPLPSHPQSSFSSSPIRSIIACRSERGINYH